jgi:hypothetical protein
VKKIMKNAHPNTLYLTKEQFTVLVWFILKLIRMVPKFVDETSSFALHGCNFLGGLMMKTDDIDPKWTFSLHYDLVGTVSHVVRKKSSSAVGSGF